MRVYDIYPEASEYLGTNDQTHIFRVGGRAVEYLANKGDWDVLKGYVDLQVQNQNLVVLPWQVDVPLKFTIDDIPAFSRDRLYEFTLNGFGSGPNGADRMDYSWEDRGFSPVQVIPPSNGFRVAIEPSTVDAGKKIYIQGQSTASGGNNEVKETLTIQATNWFISAFHYGKLTEVNKDKTIGDVRLYYVTPPPPNDNFAQAQLVAGLASDPSAPVSGYTINATVQNGEPTGGGQPPTPTMPQSPDVPLPLPPDPDVNVPVVNTVWYKWVGIDQTRIQRFWTRKDYIIEVYTGVSLESLELLARSTVVNNVALASWIQAFGITYYIRVRPPSVEAAASFGLAWNTIAAPPPPPPNDNFAFAQVVTGLASDPTAPVNGSTISATMEAGEPAAIVPNTVWYKWTGINSTERERFWTRSDYLIDVYSGSALANLVRIVTSTVVNNVALAEWQPTTGTNYWLRVRPSAGAPLGAFGLRWASVLGTVDPPPASPDLAPSVPDTAPDFPVNAPPIPLAPGPPLPPDPNPPDGTVLIAQYFPDETNPKYRVVKLSQTGATARFLFRRKVFKIVSMDDFIPIQSELGFLTMLQAIQALRRKDMEVAKSMADAAVEITTDAQRATTGFIELANNTEVQSARDYNLYNRDSVIMLDIFDDVAKILGNVGRFNIYDYTTNALEVLCTKGHWDGYTGYVDITVDGWRCVTLPRFVDQPVTISINGRPAYMRNKWSEFHLNGPGSDEQGGGESFGAFDTWSGASGNGRWGQIRAWDAVGEVVTIKPLREVSQLTAIPDDLSDDGKWIRIFGYDETGKWIRSNGEDGFLVMTDHNKLVPAIYVDQRVARITRITRQATNGFVRLYAFDIVDQTQSDLMGYYYPDETEPRYFRLKLPCDAQWIRLRYRKRTLKVTSVWQPLHLHSRMAIVTMVRSLKMLETDAAQAQVFEDKAVKFLDDDQKARNPGETFQLQFNEDCGWNSNFITS